MKITVWIAGVLFTGTLYHPLFDVRAQGLLSYNGTLEFGAKQWNFYLVDKTIETYRDFDYQLQLNLFGPLLSPRVGSYQIGLGTTASSRVENGSGKDNAKFLDTKVRSFSFGSSLFPNRPFQVSTGYNLDTTEDRLSPILPYGVLESYFSRFYLTLPRLPMVTLDWRRENELWPGTVMTTSRSASFEQSFGENRLSLNLAAGDINDFYNASLTQNKSLSAGILLNPVRKVSVNGWYQVSVSNAKKVFDPDFHLTYSTDGYGASFSLEPNAVTRFRVSHDVRFEFNAKDSPWLDPNKNGSMNGNDKPQEGYRLQRRSNASFSKAFSGRWNFDAGYSLLDQWVDAGDQHTQEDDFSLSLGGQASERTRLLGRAEVKRQPTDQILLLSADSSTVVLPGLTAGLGVSRSKSLIKDGPGTYGASADLGYNRMISNNFRFNGSIGGNMETISERFQLRAYRMQAGLDGSLRHWVSTSIYYYGLREVAGVYQGEKSDQLSLQLSGSPLPGLTNWLSYQFGRGENAQEPNDTQGAIPFWSDLTAKVEYNWRAITIALDGRVHRQWGGNSTGSKTDHFSMIGLSLKRYF